MTSNWTSFRKRILIKKPVDYLYRAWSTSGEIEKWFLEKAEYFSPDAIPRDNAELFQKDDTFIWKWNNWDFAEEGKILRANGKSGLSFTFGSGGVVHVDLKPKNGLTELTLVQEEIPTDEESKKNIYVGCATGWTFWLTNLKAWAEHGITLHATGLQQKDTTDLVNS